MDTETYTKEPLATMEVVTKQPITDIEVITERAAATVMVYTDDKDSSPARYSARTNHTVKVVKIHLDPDDPCHITVTHE